MRILLSLHSSLRAAGGASGVTQALGEAYQRLGHEALYFSFDDLPDTWSAQACQLLLPSLLGRRIRSLRKTAPVDVLDASTGDATVVIALRKIGHWADPVVATRSHGLEHVVMEEHIRTLAELGQNPGWKFPLYHRGIRAREVAHTLRHSDLAILLNEHECGYATSRLGVAQARAMVVANGLHESLLGLALAEGPSAHESPRIAQIGSYLPRKGITHGAAALNLVLARHEGVGVTFLGTGCDRSRVLADFDPQLHDRIQVVARYDRSELPGLLSGHHIKLFPTYSEGSSLALLEAMACGLAPVATGIPANLALVKDQDTALVVPPRNTASLADALERLLVDRELLHNLRRAAHARAQAFGWNAIAETTLDAYRAAAVGRR